MSSKQAIKPSEAGSLSEILAVFSKLGVTAFGGPTAHIGYFRHEFVEKRGWLSDEQFTQLLAICQFLPGPASSQMGFAIGLLRGGWLGALLAFIGFTLPSVLLLLAFAWWLPLLSGELGMAAIHGLKIVALVIVADAVIGMTKKLCPDPSRKTIAVLAMIAVLLSSSVWVQPIIVVAAAVLGCFMCRHVGATSASALPYRYGKGVTVSFLGLFLLLAAALPMLVSTHELVALADSFYRAGALVFGGGHVVLPLLEEATVSTGLLSEDTFLAGYGAAQAVPGPLFTFSAFLGGMSGNSLSFAGAAVAVIAIFLPGFLLLLAALPMWQSLSAKPQATRVLAAVNASVVGILAAALYNPIFINAAGDVIDLCIALLGFVALNAWKRSPLWVVVWCVAASMTVTYFV